MFSFLTIARGLRAVKTAMLAKNYREAITLIADVLDSAELKSVGDKVRETMTGITEDNARDTAVGAMKLLAMLLGSIFGFDKPITVGSKGRNIQAQNTDEGVDVCDKLELLAVCCDQVESGTGTTGTTGFAPAGGIISPEILDGIMQLVSKLVIEWLARRRG